VIEFEDVGVSGNQRSVARSLEALGSGSELYDIVVGLSEEQARQAFDIFSGEIHASALTSIMQDSSLIRDVTTDRLRVAKEAAGFSIWASTYGTSADWDESSANTTADLESSSTGFVFGADLPVFENVRVGALLGFADGEVEAQDRRSEADVETVHFGAYADWDASEAITVRAGLLNSWNDLETDRAVAISGFNSYSDRLTASYSADVFQLFAEAGYAFEFGALNVEPSVGLAYASLDAEEVTESGGSARLSSAGSDMETTFSTVAARADYGF
ncbi:unnamed protein product, partial [Ectocarpus sp. 12 AP-2014]